MALREFASYAPRDYLAPVPDHVLLNLANVKASDEAPKPYPTLFGPSVSTTTVLSDTPKSTATIPSTVVRSWVTKSKDAVEGTTTLQALVNLKSSSLRLSPLSESNPDEGSPHGLEFQYDCDSAKCKITVSVLSPVTTSSAAPVESTIVYESNFDGGFGRRLTLEDGVTLALSQYTSSSKPAPDNPAQEPTALPTPTHKHRLPAFAFKRRNQRSDVAGPALRVVDADTITASSDNEKKDEIAIRLGIRLEALNANDGPLITPNVQTTTLHIMRSGPADQDEDSRHWLVQVARRDAQIGSHKFRLQDIYGLSSSSSSPPLNSPPTIEDDTNSAPTYPPQAPARDAHDTEGMRSECVLCLSLPREVVLLPCRHLVACRDCAVNMVEYGAGGPLSHTSEPTGGTEADTTENGRREGGATGRDGAPRQSRRRRRAKGWFCPVCRQPYTSLLRISTTGLEPEASPTAAVTPPPQAAGANQRPSLQGRLASKPGFLRGLSRNPSQTAPTTGVDHPLQTPQYASV